MIRANIIITFGYMTLQPERTKAIRLLQGYSCMDLLQGGMRQSGVYYLQIRGTTYWFLKVFCEQEVADGGWTVSTNLLISLKH